MEALMRSLEIASSVAGIVSAVKSAIALYRRHCR